MIAAMAKNRVIGADNTMPWHLPADLRYFKKTTLGKPVIMGRKTYQSIGKALPGRPNIVISRNASFRPADASVVSSPEDALGMAITLPTRDEEIMVIGGGTIYESFLPLAQTLYLTLIDVEVEGDTQFPDYSQTGAWQEVTNEQHYADENNPYNYQFVTLNRIT
ncbi:type 3 dihydrofolate reductase [Alteromonas sp. ASW11-130]|uniref:type 3 dihydrofolate reductase n=1 Tax=Alteromonas sp. ASW11-130 TaxID=3015775 RepID=UPI0022423BB4|nr:type 3 dihydrofolate reductase [Alteromonas sp. ASW11-130]MCW8091893.1 type 3 dihydrofolate reductase [Alteromonas sp. ASW11-130]